MRTHSILIAAITLSITLARPAEANIQLSLELDREFYPYLTQSQFYAQARIQTTGEQGEAPRRPLNLSIVVDRSGSMAGDRIVQAKSAVRASRQVLSNGDILSIVTFGSQAETPIPAQRVDRLENLAFKLESIEAAGGTALYDGLNQAAAQLRRYRSDQSINRIILISDGPPTRGPREISDFASLARAFAAEKISIDAIGVGNEIHEELLAILAQETGGSLKTVMGESNLDSACSEAIHALKSPIARDARLELVFRSRLEIDEDFATHAEIDGRRLRFQWDHLYENQTLSTLLSGTIRADVADDPFGKLAEATLVYTPVGSANPDPVSLSATTQARYITSREASAESINRPVLRAALAEEIAISVRDAIAFSDQGKRNRAVREIRSSLNALKSINRDLEDDTLVDQIQDLQLVYDQFNSTQATQIEESVLSDILPAAAVSGASLPADSSNPQ